MARKKLKRFAELPTFPNVILSSAEITGKRTLELGCGKGEYTLGLARMHPERNFVGIDYQSERLWVGAKRALEEKLPNAAFLRIRIEDIEQHFAPGEVEEIWITFPDPYPRPKQAKHRLTAPAFLEYYQKILLPGGIIHLKTDDEGLFQYTKETIGAAGAKVQMEIADLWAQKNLDSVLQIQTTYEKRHVAAGRKIYYLRFLFDK